MTDLKDVLQALVDQPPAEPEPLAALEARTRRHRRRRRISLTTALASAAAVIAIAVGTLWPSNDDTSRINTVGPTDPDSPTSEPTEPGRGNQRNAPPGEIIGEGETDGVAWTITASDDGICLVVGSDASCGGGTGEWLSDGLSGRDGQERRVLWGAMQRRAPNRVSGGFRETARIEVRFANGEVVETRPVGRDAGLPVVFYVAKLSTDIPAQDTVEVIAYDADGDEVDRFGPSSTDFEELREQLREAGGRW